MKGRITQGGFLEIERKGHMCKTWCVHDNDANCCDGCIAFREPEKEKVILDGKEVTETGRTIIELCDEAGQFYFDEFIDDRE